MERQPDQHMLVASRRLALLFGATWLASNLAGCAGMGCRPRTGLFGCGGWRARAGGMASHTAPPPVNGTISDEIWQKQVDNVDAATFIVYQHEFALNSVRLNRAGEDHVKQIAARLTQGATWPVVVEQSLSTPDPDTKHKYPIHANPELDNQRREVIVKALIALGITDAEGRVIVSKAYSSGISATLAEQAFNNSTDGSGRGGGFGGGFGGFGGLGGGGVGGGFF